MNEIQYQIELKKKDQLPAPSILDYYYLRFWNSKLINLYSFLYWLFD